ncbi:phosphatase PAP2 family protein [Yoonia maritima]|uniref:phosphatase PAP2 family protein n=1 Tax=Yoonia maritima TaxID=1435347 RepID=UPI00373503FE
MTMTCFTVFKARVVGMNGYDYDAIFAKWDLAIFGKQPWEITHAIFPDAQTTALFDIIYHPAFLPMLIGYLVCASARSKPALRYTYMASFLVGFIVIGMVMAAAMSSAGPVYDDILFVTGGDFAPLISHLAAQGEEVPNMSFLYAQKYLLALQQSDHAGFGGGISAMPSMHVVMAFLWTLAGWHLNRAIGVLMTVYALLIWMISVHLGWHYFVDGLVGIIVISLIWVTIGRVMGLYPIR